MKGWGKVIGLSLPTQESSRSAAAVNLESCWWATIRRTAFTRAQSAILQGRDFNSSVERALKNPYLSHLVYVDRVYLIPKWWRRLYRVLRLQEYIVLSLFGFTCNASKSIKEASALVEMAGVLLIVSANRAPSSLCLCQPYVLIKRKHKNKKKSFCIYRSRLTNFLCLCLWLCFRREWGLGFISRIFYSIVERGDKTRHQLKTGDREMDTKTEFFLLSFLSSPPRSGSLRLLFLRLCLK